MLSSGCRAPERPLTHGCKATLLISEFSAVIAGSALCRYISYFRNVAQANSRPLGSKPPGSSGSMGDQEWRGHRTDPAWQCDRGPRLQPLSPPIRSPFATKTPFRACRFAHVLLRCHPFSEPFRACPILNSTPPTRSLLHFPALCLFFM